MKKTINHTVLKYSLVTVLGSLLSLGSISVHAQQTPPEQTGIASPDRAADRLQRDDFSPRIFPKIEIKDSQTSQAPAGAENIHFVLKSVELQDMTAYDTENLQDTYEESLGHEISLQDLYDIAASLTRKYRNDGYILSQVIVPPQTIETGDVKLRVIEGYIDNVIIEAKNEPERSVKLIKKYAKHITDKDALNAKDLERALLLINDLPGIEARTILSPSPNNIGASELRIIIDRDYDDVRTSIDNFGTDFLGPTQLNTAYSLNSVFGNNERLTMQAVVAGSQGEIAELGYYAAQYEQPVLGYGTTATVFASFTDTKPGDTLQQFDVRGYSRQVYIEVEHPFIRTRAFNLAGYAQLDYRNVTTKNNIVADPKRVDNIRAVRIGANAEFLDNLITPAYNTLDFQLSRGLNILGSTDEGDANISRPNARIDFYKLTATFQRLQKIVTNWDFFFAATGQLTNGPVLSSEEFSLGGLNYGRGFDSSEAIGNEGFGLTAELQWDNPYTFDPNIDYELFAFLDAGRVFDSDATSSGLRRETLTSSGIGFRVTLFESTDLEAFAAFPLNNTPQTEKDRDARFYFSLGRDF